MKLFVIAVCTAAALGVGTGALAQDDVVFRSGVSLVRVDAEVVDSNGRVVPGLTKDDFRVLDEGAPQAIANFSFDVEPLDLILLFDTSGSMHGKLLSIVRAAELGFHELHNTDRICVRAFSQNSTEMQPFTENLQSVNEAILLRVLPSKFGGNSRIDAAASEAAIRFHTEPKSHRKRAVLIVTDKAGSRAPDESAIVHELWNSDAVLSELILSGAHETKIVESGANAIVDRTGGATIVAGTPGDAFRDSVHYVRSGYAIYYAQPDATPGSERKVQVELTPEAAKRYPGVRVHARSGYIVPRPN
jgi:Ca-activated chloride channel homolog